MKRILIIVSVTLLLIAVSCRKSDMKTTVVNVPEMRNRACAVIIAKALTASVGVNVGDVKVDLAARTVTVRYESLHTAKKNVEYTIANTGFAANAIPANKEVAKKLPKECMGQETMIPMPIQ